MYIDMYKEFFFDNITLITLIPIIAYVAIFFAYFIAWLVGTDFYDTFYASNDKDTGIYKFFLTILVLDLVIGLFMGYTNGFHYFVSGAMAVLILLFIGMTISEGLASVNKYFRHKRGKE